MPLEALLLFSCVAPLMKRTVKEMVLIGQKINIRKKIDVGLLCVQDGTNKNFLQEIAVYFHHFVFFFFSFRNSILYAIEKWKWPRMSSAMIETR